MAGKRFLNGIRSPYLTDLVDPLLPLDAANMQWVLAQIIAAGSLPTGGATGEVLGKASNADYDVEWISGGPPFGGNSGMYFNGGTFNTPNNGRLHGGTF